MLVKNNYTFPISLLIFIGLELFLLKNSQFNLGILLYLFYCTLLFLTDKKYIISFFVFYLPLLPIVPTDYKLFSIIGPHEIIYGFSFFVLLQIVKSSNTKMNKYQKLSIKFVYFLFFMHLYIIIKDILFGIGPDKTQGAFYIFKNIVRDILYYYSLIFLIKVIYKKRILDLILNGIKYSTVVLVLSMIFSKPLILIGADIAKKGYFMSKVGENTRFVGFYGAGGDENSAGIFLVIVFGFLLALFEKTGGIKKYIVFMGFAFLGVLLSGSRTAFLGLASVIFIFLVSNRSGSTKIAILIALVLFYFSFTKQLDLVIQRFFDPSAREAVDPRGGGRVYKWIRYSEWILENPKTLLFGNQTKINFFYAPHNYLVYIIYHTGIIPLIIFINLLIKLFRSIKIFNNKAYLKNVYYILPIPFLIMTLNSIGATIYLWIFLPLGMLFLTNKKAI